MKLAIIITKPLHGDIKPMEALRYAYVAAEIEIKLYLILVDGGVLIAKKGQFPGETGYEDPVAAMKEVTGLGGDVFAEKESLAEFGLDAIDCMDTIQVVSGHEISELIKDADKTMIF